MAGCAAPAGGVEFAEDASSTSVRLATAPPCRQKLLGRCKMHIATPYESPEAMPGDFHWAERPWKPEHRLVRFRRPLVAVGIVDSDCGLLRPRSRPRSLPSFVGP